MPSAGEHHQIHMFAVNEFGQAAANIIPAQRQRSNLQTLAGGVAADTVEVGLSNPLIAVDESLAQFQIFRLERIRFD
jgi:hypothetical protein